MTAPDPDDQAWRITFVRLLLCVLLLYYLATIVLIVFTSPNHATVRDLSPILAILVCLAFAALALTRLRGEAIVAIATAALLSVWFLEQAVFHPAVRTAVFAGGRNWRIDVALIVFLAIASLPTVAFFVVWPLRPRFVTSYSDSAEPTEDSQAAPANPPVAPPE